MTGLAELLRDALVSGLQTLTAVDHHDQEVGAGNGVLAMEDDKIVERILAGAVQPARIEKFESGAAPDDGPGECVARGTGHGGDNRAPAARDSVKQRGFPNIWSSDQHDGVLFSGHFSLLSQFT